MLGNLLKHLLRRAAVRAPEPAAMHAPAHAQAGENWLSEVMRLRQDGRNREIATRCRSVLASQPDDIEALNFLAAALLAQGESHEGIAWLRRIIQLAPDAADTHANLAYVLAATGDPQGAIENYRHAVRLRADNPNVWTSFAALLKALARYDEAESCCRAGLQANAGHAALHRTLAGVLFEQGRVDAAIAEIRAALALNPDAPAAHSELLRMLNYTEAQDPAAVFREHCAWADRHARPLESAAPLHPNDPVPTRRLRIGYVSPHFRQHPVTFFLEPVIEHHDRDNFELFLYADVARPDECSERLKSHGAIWRSTVGLNDAELAQLVRRDAIDILLDLSGHTPGNRLLAFARKPAPVQVTWNGYPNTTGMSAIDYRITDAWCDPPGATEHLHSERLVRLPASYMAWRPPEDAPDAGPLPAAVAGRVTFGSFNSCYKLTPQLIALWSRILMRVPGSRLMLLTISAGAAERRIRSLFADNGIDAARLEILPRVAHQEFLAAHGRADIALDAFPYHGTTTTCFSLWMGLPVVTLAGTVHASRVGVSMLNSVGLPRLIARDADEYVEIAARLAGNTAELAALRPNLRGMLLRSPLADGRACARALETAFREMWTIGCRGQTPGAGDRAAPVPPATATALANPRNVVVQSHYGPIIVNRHDTMIGKWISRDGAWEKDEIELLRWVVSACYGCEQEIEILDIGANVGAHTLAFARFPFPKVVIHAFEAQREICDMLAGTIALNNLEHVHCHHNAVSAESGHTIEVQSIDYDQPADYGCLELEPVAKPEFDGARLPGMTERVETARIDDLRLAKVRLIKIDVEGMEHKVLPGAAGTVARCRPVIFAEYHKADFDSIKAFLRDSRYRSYYAQRPNILCVPAEFSDLRFDGAQPVNY